VKEFPHESYIQARLEQYFLNDNNFVDVKQDEFTDLHVKNSVTEWKIECKGKSQAIGIDFNTGLGQLLKGMEDSSSRYGLAMPDIVPFRKQTTKIPHRIKKLLNITWIWIKKDGTIQFE
jgi:hypothetical protein